MTAPATQLAFDLFAADETESAGSDSGDPLADRLIAGGIVANAYLLGVNRTLQNPDPLPAPSRLYRFPLEFAPRDRLAEGAPSRLLLNHPDLVDLPFVRRVAAITGFEPKWDEVDEYERPRDLPRWWHAVDLMTEAHWRHLMASRHLTDSDLICRAIAFALECPAHYQRGCRTGRIGVGTARAVLGMLGAEETVDRSEALLRGDAIAPAHIIERHHRTGKTVCQGWPINLRIGGHAGAWLMVHGIEDGWFVRDRSGHLQMAKEDLARRGRCQGAEPAIIATGNGDDGDHCL